MKETKFKNTEIGPIPVDWEVKSIAEVAPLQRGFDLPKTCLTPGDYPVVYSNGIGYYHSQFQCKAPGLITGRSGTIGKFTLISEGYYWPHNTTLWVTNFNNNNPLYLYYRYSTLSFEDSATGTGVPTLNRNYLKDKKIAMPPLAEQEAIGEALREVDELIEGLKKLVAKKRAIKQGAMSQLLSGKSRLPGFSEPWKEMILDSLADINPSCDLPDCFEYVDLDSVSKGVLLYHRTENRQTAPSRAQRLAKFGDIFFQTVRPYQKNNFYFDKDITTPFVFSTGYAQLRPYINGVFLYHAMQSNEFVNLVLSSPEKS